MAGLRVAVVGATGLVGRTMLQVLEERGFPLDELTPLASRRSAGSVVPFREREITVRLLDDESLAGCDIVLFAAGASVSRRFAPVAAHHGALVVDNSSAFRLDPDVPLVVPEVNGHLLSPPAGRLTGIVANPNCSTIQLVVVLHPLHQAFGLESVIVSTYQSVSGTGGKGVRALEHEMETGRRHPESPYPHPIAYNALPQVDVFDDAGWSVEELKIIAETRKIMDLPQLHVVPTTVRVPVRVSHSESVYARFAGAVDPDQARAVLATAPGVVVEDEPATSRYPLARNAEGRDEVFVGRIRQDPADGRALAFWVVADNLRKGAATNAVQIAEVATGAIARAGRRAQYA